MGKGVKEVKKLGVGGGGSKPSDFSDEYLSQNVKVVTDGGEYTGKLLEARKYWIKLLVMEGGKALKIIYLNKAFVKSIEPLEVKVG